jgi:large subunit ribosomal protein L4
MQFDIFNTKGEKTGRSIELPNEIFGATPNNHVMYLAVKQYLAAQRQGTSKVKTRAEVQGASRKLHKQKGTGGSRKGNIRNPLYKGGGTIFGPKPHGYGFKINRQEKELARKSALSAKAASNSIMIVEDLAFQAPKTQEFVSILNNLNIKKAKTLFVIQEHDSNLHLSTRNLGTVLTTTLHDINTYDILNSKVILFTEGVAKMFHQAQEELKQA